MTLPKPEAGLVVRYAYLWVSEHRMGREEGSKDRPCAIVLAVDLEDGAEVLVVPITHRAPMNADSALELPPTVKDHLGLDGDRSWAILSESNVFRWPGPDLRLVATDRSSFSYGYLPPRFFAELRRRFVTLETAARSRRVGRSE